MVSRPSRTRAGVRIASGLVAALVLLSATLAVSSLHRHSHRPEKSGDEQQCGLCLFAHGKFVADGGATAPIQIPLKFIEPGCLLEPALPERIEYRWSPSRAPPA